MKKKNNSINKQGQITIFAIAGIIIVAAIIMFFAFRNNAVPGITQKAEENPESFFSSCLNEKVREAIQNISLHGGYLNDSLHKEFKFKNESFVNISYLCYNQNNYFPCINQKPLLFFDVQKEIKKYIQNKVQGCFDELSSTLSGKGYTVKTDYNGFEVQLLPERMVIQTDSEIVLTKSGESTTYTNLKATFLSKLYGIVGIVAEIVNQESEFCHFEKLGFNLLYSQYSVDSFRTGDILIYTVSSLDTKEKFRFALRGCAIPPGI